MLFDIGNPCDFLDLRCTSWLPDLEAWVVWLLALVLFGVGLVVAQVVAGWLWDHFWSAIERIWPN